MNLDQKLEFEVTQDNCDNGLRYNCFLCPVALALTEAHPNLRWRVRSRYARALDPANNNREVARYAIPADLGKSITEYDSGKPMPTGKHTITQDPRATLDHYNGGPINKVRP